MGLKIGILGCGYACDDRLEERLNPWFNLSKELNFTFAFISAQFKEYKDLDIIKNNTKTTEILSDYHKNGQIQFLDISYSALLECEARDIPLQTLISYGVDLIYLLDLGDEFYTKEQILTIFDYINSPDNQLYATFNTPMKNYIFDGKQWIGDFCPARGFRVNYNEYKLDKMTFDNDVDYKNKDNNLISHNRLPNKKIPRNLLNNGIRHETWLHENGKQKYLYQLKHFNGVCSYIYNDETEKLEFNKEGYYKKFNIPIPEIFTD